MTVRVARTCTEIRDDRQSGESERPGGDSIEWQGWPGAPGSGAGSDGSHPLVDFRESHACVLLGAPGAGKTTELRYEAECTGGHYVTVRDFLTFDHRPEWRGATLFIDGLDEIRAGSSDGRTPLDGIRRSLEFFGRPRFRLSCREADWFGADDRIHLEMVSRDGQVKVLRLDSLSDDGIREILNRHAGIDSPEEFITAARERGIDSLLANSQNLEMLADAVAGGTWPDSRMGAFELACKRLVREPNPGHRLANPNDPPASELLDAAGRVCALQLICGLKGADEKRSDIRVSFGDSNVPMEIKKSNHRNLWSAIRDQLIAKYSRDPGSGGWRWPRRRSPGFGRSTLSRRSAVSGQRKAMLSPPGPDCVRSVPTCRFNRFCRGISGNGSA